MAMPGLLTCPACRREVGNICLAAEYVRCGCIDCHECTPRHLRAVPEET